MSAELSGFQPPMDDIPGKVVEKRYSGMANGAGSFSDMSVSKARGVSDRTSVQRAQRDVYRFRTVNASFELGHDSSAQHRVR